MTPPPRRGIVASYDYRDEGGAVLFQVLRYAEDLRQRCPDGTAAGPRRPPSALSDALPGFDPLPA